MRSGSRVGDYFLWIDVDTVSINGDKALVLTARKHVTGGDVVSREFATMEHAHALRRLAKDVEDGLIELRPKEGK